MYNKRSKNWILHVTGVIEQFLMNEIKSDKLHCIDHTDLLNITWLDKITPMDYIKKLADNDDSGFYKEECDEIVKIYALPDITMNTFLNNFGYDYLVEVKGSYGISQESMAEDDILCTKYNSILMRIMEKYLIMKTENIIIKKLHMDDFIKKLSIVVDNMKYFDIFDNKCEIIDKINKIAYYNNWRRLQFYPNIFIKFYESEKIISDKIILVYCSWQHDVKYNLELNLSKFTDLPIEIVNIILLLLLKVS